MCFLHFCILCISKTLNESRQKRYTEDDICHESNTTIEKVDICPPNIEILNRRSIKKNCSRHQTCTGDRLVYHCVMNGGGLVEVCAPRSLITGRFCPYYEKGLGRVIENIRKHCITCPFQYHSDEYLKNPECIPASATKEGSSEQKSSINANITTSKPNPSGTNKGVFIVESLGENISIFSFEVIGKNSEHGLEDGSVASGENIRKQKKEKHTDQNDTYIIVSVISICFCLVLWSSLTYLFRKRLQAFCPMHKDYQKQFNDLYSGSCEPMIIKK